jgi:hypothetical protein
MKKFLTSLGINEMQIKIILKFHLTSVRMATINKTNSNKCWREYEKKDPSSTVGGNVN